MSEYKEETRSVELWLKGISFPCSKQALTRCARRNGAKYFFLSSLEYLPESVYRSMRDVMKGIITGNQLEQVYSQDRRSVRRIDR